MEVFDLKQKQIINPIIIILILVFIYIIWDSFFESFINVPSTNLSLIDKFLKQFEIDKAIGLMFITDDRTLNYITKKTKININQKKHIRYCEIIEDTMLKKLEKIYNLDDILKPQHTSKFGSTFHNKNNYHIIKKCNFKDISNLSINNNKQKYLISAPIQWFIDNNLIENIDYTIIGINTEKANLILNKFSEVSDNKVMVLCPCLRHQKKIYDMNELIIGMTVNDIDELLSLSE